MKKVTYLILLVLFILSACQPGPGGQGQAATATCALDRIPVGLPALIPSSSDALLITLDDYPLNSDGFLIDKRLNNEKMELVKQWAPDDVEKEIALYNTEFERKGIDLKNITYKVSIVDGKSWVLYPYNRRTGEGYIVSIDGVIQASIDLFGYLDRPPEEFFFDLIPVSIDKPEVVGDISGWHVFAKIQNGKIIQWYDAVHDTVETVEIESTPSPTPEELKIVSTISKEDYPKFENLSRVTFEDFTSGKLNDLTKEWLINNPFSEKAVPITKMKFLEVPQDLRENAASDPLFQFDTLNIQFLPSIDYSDPETRPIKIVSYYVLWDENLFRALNYTDKVFEENAMYGVSKRYQFAKLGIMSWAWLNPDGSTVTGCSLINFSSSKILEDINEIMPMPLIDVYNYKENIPNNIIYDHKAIIKIYSLYPNLKPPEELTKEWVETGIMPEELVGKLFGLAPILANWKW